jgi:outer membrane protein assembly factor BamB
MQHSHYFRDASPAWRRVPFSTTSAIQGTCRLLLLLSLLLMACSLCGGTDLLCGVAPAKAFIDWTQFHFVPCHTGFNPHEFILSPVTVGSLALRWSYQTGSSEVSSSAVANGVMYFAAGYGNAALYALNASTGVLLWRSRPVALLDSPVVANGVVYIDSSDGYLHALNGTTGTPLWRFPNGYLGGDLPTAPTVANGVVYIGSNDRNLYAVNANTGALLWKYTIGGAHILSSPAVANGVVYFGSFDEPNFYALNASTGALLWKYTTGSVPSSPAVVNGVVYIESLFTSDNYYLHALDAATGALLWGSTVGQGIASPAVANGVVYAGSSNGGLYALNASTGAPLWQYPTAAEVDSSPAVANGVVYFGSDDNNLYALNAATGALLWQYTTGGVVRSSPTVVNGVVYVGSEDGNLYSFGLSGGLLSKSLSLPELPDPALLQPSTPLTITLNDLQKGVE